MTTLRGRITPGTGGGGGGRIEPAKTVSPALTDVVVEPATGYDGMKKVTVEAVNLQDKTVLPAGAAQTVTADSGYLGLGSVTVAAATLQNKTVTPGPTVQTVTADSGNYGLGTVTVDAVHLQNKTVSPSASQQAITADSGYTGLGTVTVNAVSLQSKTVNPQSYAQTVRPDSGYNGLSSVTVNAAEGHDYELLTGDWLDYEGEYVNSEVQELMWGLPFDCSLPNITNIAPYALYGSRNCENLTCASLETVGEYAFSNNVLLKKLDAGNLSSINAHAFEYAYSFATLIIRKTGSACRLVNANALASTAIANESGYIYVPDALVDTYKAATNWVTYASQIKPLSELPS